jgi:septin family protein
MQKLASKVNIIPVIAKADSVTREELDVLKKGVLADLARHDIHIYPIFNADDRENITEIEKHVPFAVIGSNELISVNGKSVRGRTYKWGSVQVDNPEHSDFVHLRDMLIMYFN